MSLFYTYSILSEAQLKVVHPTPVLNTQERKTYQNMRGETYFIFIYFLQSMGETDMIRRVSCTVE